MKRLLKIGTHPWCKSPEHWSVTQHKENKEVNMIDPNRNNSYKTKKNFTDFPNDVNSNLG